MKKIFTHLTFYVILAIVSGILLGHFFPEQGVKMEIIGKSFISIIKLFIAPIIFLTIVLGIGSMGNLKKVGRIGLKSLVYFEIVTTLALAIGVGVAFLFKPGNIDKASLVGKDASKFISKAAEPFSWLHFIRDNFTIQVLIIAILIGISLTYLKNRESIVIRLEKASKFVFKTLKYVMYLAPLGAFGGMAYVVGEYGLNSLLPLGKLVGCVYFTMIAFVIIVL